MKLNDFELDNYQSSDNKVTFVLSGDVLSEAVTLDGKTLTVMDGEQQVAVFSGYEVVAVYIELGNTVVVCMRELKETVEAAITGLDSNVRILTGKVDTAEQSVANLTEKVTTAESNVTTFTAKVTNAEQNVTELTERVGNAEQSVSDLDGKVTNAENSVTSMSGRVDTAEQNVSTLTDKVTTTEQNITTLTEKVDGAELSVSNLKTQVDSTEQTVTALDSAVSEVAKAANPDVVAFAKMAVPTMTVDMTATEICSVVSLLPEWKVGAKYDKGQAFTYEGKVYCAAQAIPEAQDIYKPGEGTESLYTLIEIAEDGVRVWKKPTDATNSFAFGERAHYPTASDSIYVSKREGNTSEPTKDKWWEILDEDVSEE